MRYDEVPYVGHPVPYASPAALALAARVHGGPRARVRGARVLEVGCGDGAHLVPLAFHDPDGEYVGVDLSDAALARARDASDALGLSNVTWVHADLAALPELAIERGTFDHVVAHGVYSWVDAGRREALRRGMRRALGPSGLGYVCFNAMPGWGVRGRVRDALKGLDLEAARARARGLHALVEESGEQWPATLAHELGRVLDADDGYLAHEYLAEHNDAFWLREVVDAFAADGLCYAGDAQALSHEGWVPPALADAVDGLASEPLARAELIDLVAFRQLRGVVFARDDAAFDRPAGDAIVDEAGVYGVLRPLSETLDPTPGVEEPFVAPNGVEVRIASAVSKLAMVEMSARYPDAFAFDALLELGAAAASRLRIPPDLHAAPGIREGLAQLVRHRALELRLGPRTIRREPGPTPRATALARFEASARGALTTPIHSVLPLDPVDREIVRRLDGAPRDAIVDALTADVVEGRVSLEGTPSGAMRVRPMLEGRVDQLLATLGWWGLVS